ncbi:hypothetical protein ACIA49_24745 [Kribbella sp. NPDC051587]|uniref:hypothetical protein n=1 Tax=Kribbella sp. NPDC051587 TaxID=3364119 RepID=UPI0037936F11
MQLLGDSFQYADAIGHAVCHVYAHSSDAVEFVAFYYAAGAGVAFGAAVGAGCGGGGAAGEAGGGGCGG